MQSLVGNREQIKYLNLSMKDQIDADISLFLYTSIEFIEEAMTSSQGKAKILLHCQKV